MSSLSQRYWHALTMAPAGGGSTPAPRSWQRYGLWRRYWSTLLGFRLPVPHSVEPETHRGGVTEPVVEGTRLRLPRFDRLSVRMAGTEDIDHVETRLTVGKREFIIRGSGPGEVELLIRTGEQVPEDRVLPIEVATASGGDRYLMIFGAGSSVGVLHLTGTAGWVDVVVDEPMAVTALDRGDAATLAAVARSVAATPDPAMPTWAAIAAARPDDDPLSRTIRDAAA